MGGEARRDSILYEIVEKALPRAVLRRSRAKKERSGICHIPTRVVGGDKSPASGDLCIEEVVQGGGFMVNGGLYADPIGGERGKNSY